jgi:hypothetical protein
LFEDKVELAEVYDGAEMLVAVLSEHIGFVIAALRPHAAELGLQGRAAAEGESSGSHA